MVEQFDRALRLANTRIVEAVGNFLPGALVFLVVLAVALAVALVLRSTVRRGLNSLDFDRRAELLGMSLASWTPSHSASTLIASIVYWTILMLGLLLGLTALDAALPSQFAVSVLEYVPHLLAALAIGVAAAVVSLLCFIAYTRQYELETSGGEGVTVLVAVRRIERGAIISDSSLTTKTIPRAWKESFKRLDQVFTGKLPPKPARPKPGPPVPEPPSKISRPRAASPGSCDSAGSM